MYLTGVGNMKATEKIKLMIRLEKGFKKLDFEELHLIAKTQIGRASCRERV